jgi:hypothetical protein
MFLMKAVTVFFTSLYHISHDCIVHQSSVLQCNNMCLQNSINIVKREPISNLLPFPSFIQVFSGICEIIKINQCTDLLY